MLLWWPSARLIEVAEPEVGTFTAPGGASQNPRWKLPPWLKQREEQEQRVEEHAEPTQTLSLGAPAYLAPVEVTFPESPPVIHREPVVTKRWTTARTRKRIVITPKHLPDAATPRPVEDDDEETVLLLLSH